MVIAESAPMLTCTKSNDGFQYELVLRADEGKPTITKVRFGPYHFKDAHKPKPGLFGISSGGPEPGFWMHQKSPRGWSRLHWEIVDTEHGSPAYLVSKGALSPGKQGIFRFLSLFPPGGMRAGLEISRGDEKIGIGVTGPNYEEFLQGDH